MKKQTVKTVVFTNTVKIVNCLKCEFCIEKKNSYTCLFKKCNMGETPFYINKEINLYHLGFKTCNYSPKIKTKIITNQISLEKFIK